MKSNKIARIVTKLLSTIIIVGSIVEVYGSVSERDLTLTAAQKKALDKFKDAIGPSIRKDYQKGESYLIKWLRGANYDPKLAVQKLKSDMKWRRELRMDTIHDEDWSEFRSLYEYNVDGVDKAGQPLLIVDFGNWDFRQGIVSGHRAKLERYVYKMLDHANVALKKRQEEGNFVTRSNAVFNLDGYNTVQHGCIPCVSLYLTLASALDKHFPELLDQMIIINAPSIFEVVLSAVKPAMPAELRNSIALFGTSKREWQKYLRNLVEDDQLPFDLGGTKEFVFSY